MNVCDSCEDSPENPILYDTGVCDLCKKTMECKDPELLMLYRGIGFSDEFISGHLPRLRANDNALLSWTEIGEEISRHVMHGECHDHACQGYGLDVRKTLRFEK